MGTVVELKATRRTIYRSPDQPLRVLSAEEQKAILRATRDHRRGYRDHLMFSLALLAGLRAGTIVGLNIGEVRDSRGRIRSWVEPRPKIFKGQRPYAIPLGRELRAKVRAYLRWREREEGRKLQDEDALLVSRTGGGRLTVRSLERAWAVCQDRIGIDRPYRLHDARHTFGTAIQRRGKDALLTKALLGHASLRSTERYLHASRGDMAALVQELRD